MSIQYKVGLVNPLSSWSPPQLLSKYTVCLFHHPTLRHYSTHSLPRLFQPRRHYKDHRGGAFPATSPVYEKS